MPIIKTATKPDEPASAKVRMAIQGAAMGLQFTGMILASKDTNTEGWDDYFAMKINQVASEMQQFALTGKLPTEGE